MNNSDPNSFDDQHEMSDTQLDELLGLPNARPGRDRQKRVRRNAIRVLKTSRPRMFVDFRSAGLVAAACCLLLVAWIGWDRWDRWSTEQPLQTTVVAQKNALEVDRQPAEAFDTDLMNSPPEIFTRVVATKHNQRRKHHRDHFRKNKRWVANLDESFDWGLKRLADSDAGLQLIEQFCVSLDRATIPDSYNMNGRRIRAGSRRQIPNQDLQQQLKILQSARQQMEAALVRRLDRPADASAAMKVLCRCGTARSLPAILNHWNRSSFRQDIVVAANRVADSQTLGRLVLATDDPDLQSRIMSQLLCRNDPISLDLFLETTARNNLYPIAQASGRIAHCMPAEKLLVHLRSNRLSIARAAAITLSEMDDPRIPVHLIQLARSPNTSQSAVMALTARRDSSSVRFIELAASDIRWSATVDNAKRKWSRLLN